jgi:HEPN domain-containing protein
LTKQEHINYWKVSAEKDWEVVQDLFNSQKYLHCLFFAHLVLEKLCKAHWVKDNSDDYPPRLHNLIRIITTTKLSISEEDLQFLEEFNDFQLEGRYPDYTMNIYKICNFEFTKEQLSRVEKIRSCLLTNLS